MTHAQSTLSAPERIIAYQDVKPHITWQGAVDALRRGHMLARAQTADVLIGPPMRTLLNRTAYIPDFGYAVKAETVIADNISKGLPSGQGLVTLYDANNGSVRAVIESKIVTDYKTVADSILAAQLLARPNSRHVLIVGAGTIASNLIEAYAALLPELETITIWSRRHAQAEILAEQFRPHLRQRIHATADLERAVGAADIISTATMARSPILLGDWIRPGTHVDLIGAFTLDMREADDRLFEQGHLYVDLRESTVECTGELQHPLASGVITLDDIKGDLYQMLASNTPLRTSDDDITIFKNGGGAHLDLMIAHYIAELMHTHQHRQS